MVKHSHKCLFAALRRWFVYAWKECSVLYLLSFVVFFQPEVVVSRGKLYQQHTCSLKIEYYVDILVWHRFHYYSNLYISDQSICIIWLVSFLILKSVAPCDIMVESERDWLFLFILDKYDFWRCCRYSPKHSLKLWLLCSLLILLLFQARCIHIYAPQTICRMWSCKVQRNKQKTCLNSEL